MKRTLALTLSLILLAFCGLALPATAQVSKRDVQSIEETVRLLNRIRLAERNAERGVAVGSATRRDLTPFRAPSRDLLAAPLEAAPKGALDGDPANVSSGATISGTLHNLTVSDAADVSVIAFTADSSANGTPNGTATAYFGKISNDGSYVIEDVAPGTYYVVARAHGYVPLFYDNVTTLFGASALAVLDGDMMSGIDFRMQKVDFGQASIVGRVTANSDGSPIANAYVTVISLNQFILYASVPTDRDGYYEITGLSAGTYYATVWADGYLGEYFDDVESFEDATPIDVTPTGPQRSVDFGLGRGGVISGVVTDDDGYPVAGVYVQAHTDYGIWVGPDGTIGRGHGGSTDPGGVWDPDSTGQTGGGSVDPDVPDDSTSAGDPGGSMDSTNTGYHDGSGQMGDPGYDPGHAEPGYPGFFEPGYPGFSDPPIPSDSGIVFVGFGSAVTDENGRYVIGGLQSGEYFASAFFWEDWFSVVEWYDDAPTLDQATPIAVEKGQETTGIDFGLAIPGEFGGFSGVVKDGSGNPIEGAFIQAQAPFNSADSGLFAWAYAYTDRNGEYTIGRIPEGEYLVSAWGTMGWQYVHRYWPNAETPEEADPVVVSSGLTEGIDFVLPLLPESSSISGLVLRNTGDPLANAYVQVSPAERGPDGVITDILPNSSSGGIWASAVTDNNGRYKIDRLPPGKYVAQAQYWEFDTYAQQWYDHAPTRREATVIGLAEGEHRGDVSFDLAPRSWYGTVGGTVVDDATGRPIRRAYVEVTPVGVEYRMAPFVYWSHYAITDDAGQFRIDWLFEGEYILQTWADGAHEFFDDAYRPADATPLKVVGGEALRIKVGLTRQANGTGAIAGRVTQDWSDGAPEIAVVTARPASNSTDRARRIYNTVTGPRGGYELKGLTAGKYYVFSFAPGHIGEYFEDAYRPEDATLIEVADDRTTPGVDFSLSPVYYLDAAGGDIAGVQRNAMIFGTVTDENGEVIQDAAVYLLDEAGEPVAFARSDSDGAYEFPGVPPGQYMVQVTQLGYESAYYEGAEPSPGSGAVIEVSGAPMQIDFSLDPAAVTDAEDPEELPETFVLLGNYPNPFNPQTRISFRVPVESEIQVRVFNTLGQQVRVLLAGRRSPGESSVEWNGLGSSGHELPSGVYLYVLEADGRAVGRSSMVLLR